MRPDGVSPDAGAAGRAGASPRPRPRTLATAVLTAVAGAVNVTAGVAPAHAADGVHAAGRPRHDVVNEPARGIARFRMLSTPGALGTQPLTQPQPQPQAAQSQTSSNWAGYAATGAVYTSVTASWVQPGVTCTTSGIIAFWVGLDGWGSDSVEQDGTGVDCSSGTPRQFAWWETYPADSIQRYTDPVSAGDRLTSTVTSAPGGVYDLVLTDATRGWTERKAVTVTGARNASAEVVAEAVSSDGAITPLPDFHTVDFRGVRIDGQSLQASGAQPIDLAGPDGGLLAHTSAADTAGDFDIDYTGTTTPARS